MVLWHPVNLTLPCSRQHAGLWGLRQQGGADPHPPGSWTEGTGSGVPCGSVNSLHTTPHLHEPAHPCHVHSGHSLCSVPCRTLPCLSLLLCPRGGTGLHPDPGSRPGHLHSDTLPARGLPGSVVEALQSLLHLNKRTLFPFYLSVVNFFSRQRNRGRDKVGSLPTCPRHEAWKPGAWNLAGSPTWLAETQGLGHHLLCPRVHIGAAGSGSGSHTRC